MSDLKQKISMPDYPQKNKNKDENEWNGVKGRELSSVNRRDQEIHERAVTAEKKIDTRIGKPQDAQKQVADQDNHNTNRNTKNKISVTAEENKPAPVKISKKNSPDEEELKRKIDDLAEKLSNTRDLNKKAMLAEELQRLISIARACGIVMGNAENVLKAALEEIADLGTTKAAEVVPEEEEVTFEERCIQIDNLLAESKNLRKEHDEFIAQGNNRKIYEEILSSIEQSKPTTPDQADFLRSMPKVDLDKIRVTDQKLETEQKYLENEISKVDKAGQQALQENPKNALAISKDHQNMKQPIQEKLDEVTQERKKLDDMCRVQLQKQKIESMYATQEVAVENINNGQKQSKNQQVTSHKTNIAIETQKDDIPSQGRNYDKGKPHKTMETMIQNMTENPEVVEGPQHHKESKPKISKRGGLRKGSSLAR